MAATLSNAEIAERLGALSAWRHEGSAIVAEVQLADFAAAIALVDRVAEVAEAANHHPDILVHDYRVLRLTLSTHSVGGLTHADLDLAAQLDGLLRG